EAPLLQCLARRRRAPVLPDDRVSDRLAGGAVPDDRRLALVGDADAGDVGCLEPGTRERLARGCELRAPDLARVVLDPSRLRIDLAELALRQGNDPAARIEHDRARARRALVEGEQVARCRHGESSQVTQPTPAAASN